VLILVFPQEAAPAGAGRKLANGVRSHQCHLAPRTPCFPRVADWTARRNEL